MNKVVERKHVLADGTFNGIIQFWFYCPGCERTHPYTIGPQLNGYGSARWQFNGDFEKPTFTPSLLWNPDHPKGRCHLHLTDGIIQFCNDCYHSMNGRKIDCPDISFLPEWLTNPTISHLGK